MVSKSLIALALSATSLTNPDVLSPTVVSNASISFSAVVIREESVETFEIAVNCSDVNASCFVASSLLIALIVALYAPFT